MFNKKEFSIILKKINSTYNTMTEFAQKASFDRTYISKYINMKIDNPPTPKILEKIANASNGVISYKELMIICNYIDNELDTINGNSINPNSKKINYTTNVSKNINFLSGKLFVIPILKKVISEKTLLEYENIEGYLPIDPIMYNISDPDGYFFLKVIDESMNKLVKNGSYVLIQKQNCAKNGDVIVSIVNGDNEATLKRYNKLNNQFVMLESVSENSFFKPITIDLKATSFKIIGKVVGDFKRWF